MINVFLNEIIYEFNVWNEKSDKYFVNVSYLDIVYKIKYFIFWIFI